MTLILDHPVFLLCILFLVYVSAVEVGFRLAIATGANSDREHRKQISTSRDSLGVLLSLLLGFTLAMAMPRYDLRRQLVLEEANAIGTTSLRGELLPEPQRGQVHELLRQYVETRLAYSRGALHENQTIAAIRRSKELQSALWENAKVAASQRPTPVVALFVSSLNDTIDLSEKRLTALQTRIPPTIWIMLTIMALLTCLTIGYGQLHRFWLASVITPLMIAIVMGLIADLDSSRSGFLRVDLRSMERLYRDFQSEIPEPVPPSSTVR
jgi:hypothetical protein